jgi:MFS family permease
MQCRWMYASNIAFFFAMNGQFVVRSYLAFKLTGSAFSLGLVNLAVAIPMLFISPFGGVVADRVEKKRLIMTGQALLLANELVVLVLLLAGLLEFWHLLLVVFAMGCLFPFIMPARQAIVANIVGRQGLGNAMALQMGGMNGPAWLALSRRTDHRGRGRAAYVGRLCSTSRRCLAMSRVDCAYPSQKARRRA